MQNNEQNFIVEKIRTQYTEKSHTQLDTLRALDAKVKRPANVFGYIFGTFSALILGSGMSLVMTDLGAALGLKDAMIPGVVIGVLGLFMAIVNYPIYKGILRSRRKKYAPKIVALSDALLEG